MTVEVFEKTVATSEFIHQNDRLWFPKWVRRYAMGFRRGLTEELPVNRDAVLKFSRSLLASGAPAWQRWQAVRAIECYQHRVLQRTEPDLSAIIGKLAQLGKQERNIDLQAPPTEEELRRLRGNLNRNEPTLIQTMRADMRVLHYSMATEKVYVRWVKRFMKLTRLVVAGFIVDKRIA